MARLLAKPQFIYLYTQHLVPPHLREVEAMDFLGPFASCDYVWFFNFDQSQATLRPVHHFSHVH